MKWLALALACTGCRAHFDDQATGDAARDTRDACTEIPGLLAYYPMNAGDLAGTAVRDHSGNARDGTLLGDSLVKPSIVSMGHADESMDFRGTTTGNLEYIEIGNLPLPTSNGEGVTISMWINRASNIMVSDVLIDLPPSPRYDVWMVNSRLCINTQNSECWGVTSSTLVDRWAHVTAVIKNGIETQSELYIDGIAQSSGCVSDPTFPCTFSRAIANPLRLSAGDSTYTYRGLMDEVRVYDHVLSAQQIAALAQDRTCL